MRDAECIRLNQAFSYVEDEFLMLVESKEIACKKRPAYRMWVAAAACICLVILLPVTAVANNWFGLRDLLLPGRKEEAPGFISMSNYLESPETRALLEWQEFLELYQAQHANETEEFFFSEEKPEWRQYSVTSQEMGEKLDEIAKKWGLKLHTRKNILEPEELIEQTGGAFLPEEMLDWGYLYEDGAFLTEGAFEPAEGGRMEFQLWRAVKGTFNQLALNIGDEEYIQWQYAASEKDAVLLALGEHKALLIADFENCFIVLNVLSGQKEGVTKENLQELADQLDFAVLKKIIIPELKPEEEEYAALRNETMTSASDYMDGESPEAKALKEWNVFLEEYGMRNVSGKEGEWEAIEKERPDWTMYRVSSHETGEKLDEIAGKWGLKLHKEIFFPAEEEFLDRVGQFIEKDAVQGCYIYDDGTFSMDGRISLSEAGETVFQIRRSVKGVFDDVELNIGKLEDYSQFPYRTADGEEVLLALSSYKAMILADFEECFLLVNVLSGEQDGMTQAGLKELADKINFGILKTIQKNER